MPERAVAVDAGLALLLVTAAEVHVWSGAAGGSEAVTAPAGAAIAGAVAFRRRAPLAAVAIAMAATSVQTILASSPQALWLIASWLVLFFSAGMGLGRRRALVALAIGLAGAGIDEAGAADRSVQGLVFALIALVLVPWLAGRALRLREGRAEHLQRRAATLERESEETTRRALEAERARIARDLHDIVAHGVSLMVLNAEAGEAVLDADPERTRGQLASIQQTGRQALSEMTRLLGMLRADESDRLTVQPRIAQLPALVEDVRKAGLDVALRIEGAERQLEPGVDLTVYRIVQEALTNALKHGRRAEGAEVVLRFGREAVAVDVRNAASTARAGGSSGHGLIGMRERVALYGGTLRAAPGDDGTFMVEATVPTNGGTR